MAAMAAALPSSLLSANSTSTISHKSLVRNPKPLTFLPGCRISQTQRHSYTHIQIYSQSRSHSHSHSDDIAPSCSFSLSPAPNSFGNTTYNKLLKQHYRDYGRDVVMNGGEESVPSMAVGLGGVGVVGVVGAGMMMMVVVPEMAHASEMVVSNVSNVVSVDDASWSALVASEPKNALSLPTWVIHVASVVECHITLRPGVKWELMNVSGEWRQLVSAMQDFVFGSREVQNSFREMELTNVLSLPTWFIHVASVVEWITAMGLVWRYGDTPGKSTWKGLSWGMVPLLGGAMCACTWHFFYNAQSLEVLVVLQAALTLIGNFTMWAAAFRIYQASQQQSKAP